MKTPDAGPTPSKKPSALVEMLRHPTRLRVALGLVLLAAWYFAVFSPMVARVDDAGRGIAEDRQRLGLAREIEVLRAQADRVKGRLVEGGDREQLAKHLMEGVRRVPALQLSSLEPRPPIDIGPYKAAVYRLVVRGDYREIDELLRWLETSPRLLRIDSIRLSIQSKSALGSLATVQEVEMQVQVIGIIG